MFGITIRSHSHSFKNHQKSLKILFDFSKALNSNVTMADEPCKQIKTFSMDWIVTKSKNRINKHSESLSYYFKRLLIDYLLLRNPFSIDKRFSNDFQTYSKRSRLKLIDYHTIFCFYEIPRGGVSSFALNTEIP